MVTGPAARIAEPLELSRCWQLLVPWIDMDIGHVVRICAGLVTVPPRSRAMSIWFRTEPVGR